MTTSLRLEMFVRPAGDLNLMPPLHRCDSAFFFSALSVTLINVLQCLCFCVSVTQSRRTVF